MTMPESPLIELAREKDFPLGDLLVRPSMREVSGVSGKHTLEPRVMQVLVALAEARGSTVSRDELIARCWGRMVVGDDAVQRCIGKLRKLADLTGSFTIETLSRIGYRLIALSPHDPTAAAPPAETRLLVVLPFDNLSGDPELGYVADGVADEILQAISRRSTIRTIGRTSSFQFRGENKDVDQIADALGATHLLDGSVRRVGGHVRIAAHLMDLSDRTMIWSDRFDGNTDDLFALQDVVAVAAVKALDGQFVQARSRPARTAEAHDLILHMHSWTGPPASDDLPSRLLRLERLRTLAGDDAAAWGILASAGAALSWVLSSHERIQVREQARHAAHRALELDPANGSAHKALYLLEPTIGRYIEAEKRLLAARTAAPDDGEVHWSLYTHYLSVGRLQDSFAEAENAYRVDPLRPPNVMAYANALFTQNREPQALGLMRHALDRWPQDPLVFAIALWTAASAGEFAFLDDIMQRSPFSQFPEDAKQLIAPALLAIEAIRRPSIEIRTQALGMLRTDVANGPPRLSLLGLCAALGVDLDELYDLIEASCFEPLWRADVTLSVLDGPAHLFLRVNTRLRESPRFVHLCRRLGLVDYWRASGTSPDCFLETSKHYNFAELAELRV